MMGKMNEGRSPFDIFCDELQEEINQEIRDDYSPNAIDLMKHKYNWGKMENATASAKYTGPCGDTMEFFLKVVGNRVEEITFLTDGCMPTIASGCQATLLAKGKMLDDVEAITSKQIHDAIGKLPEAHHHCPVLAQRALAEAVKVARGEKD